MAERLETMLKSLGHVVLLQQTTAVAASPKPSAHSAITLVNTGPFMHAYKPAYIL